MTTQPISRSRHVFIDESGDPDTDLDKAGVSEYFVLTAVVVDSLDLPQEERKAQGIVDRFFPKGEIKSSRVGSNLSRRSQILDEVCDLRFKHYSQVIDKSRVHTESGLRFRRSFVKYVNRALYTNLFQAFSNLYVIADRYGRSEFMEGFLDYLERRIPQRLFERAEIQFADSFDQPFIQVADLIAGTIQRCYSGRDPMSTLDGLREHTIIIDEWPPRFPEPLGVEKLDQMERFDYLVRSRAFQQVDLFIEERARSEDEYVQAQVAAARYVLYHFRAVDPEEYIPTAKLHRHLIELGFPMSERVLRSRVIASLRDEAVFIASSRKGLKIPYSVSDLREFATMVNSQLVPYLSRLEICREYFLLATNGELDIVQEEEFPQLARYLRGGPNLALKATPPKTLGSRDGSNP